MKYFFGIISIAFMAACTQNKTKLTASHSDTLQVATDTVECYTYVKNRDTILMQINIKDFSLTGNLEYKIFEKDQSKGSLKGELRGDTLVAVYSFTSEGMESVRELAFLKTDSTLIQGFGNIEVIDNKETFKDLKLLKFDSGLELVKKNCE